MDCQTVVHSLFAIHKGHKRQSLCMLHQTHSYEMQTSRELSCGIPLACSVLPKVENARTFCLFELAENVVVAKQMVLLLAELHDAAAVLRQEHLVSDG